MAAVWLTFVDIALIILSVMLVFTQSLWTVRIKL